MDSSNSTYSSMMLTELQSLLRNRHLAIGGGEPKLVDQLVSDDAQLASERGFPQFLRLPVEIQTFIWELSLPGPRVLSVDTSNSKAHKIAFHSSSQAPNPAALSTCRASRAAALKRYRLCFGTTNVFADLLGGDVLYFGRWDECLVLSVFWIWWRKPSDMDDSMPVFEPSIRADLEEVRHIAIEHYSLSILYNIGGVRTRRPQILGNVTGAARLRDNLKKLKSLKLLSLVCGGTEHRHKTVPGRFFLVDQSPMVRNEVYLTHYQSWASPFVNAVAREFAINSGPDMNLVHAYHIDDGPMRKYQDLCGLEHTELYVCTTHSSNYGFANIGGSTSSRTYPNPE
jgi:hypothetical protein